MVNTIADSLVPTRASALGLCTGPARERASGQRIVIAHLPCQARPGAAPENFNFISLSVYNSKN